MSINFSFDQEGYDATEAYNFNFGEVGASYYYLFKDTPNFTSVWADITASIDSGKVYVASQDHLYVIDLNTQTLYDWYNTTRAGRAQETLNNDITDINVNQ